MKYRNDCPAWMIPTDETEIERKGAEFSALMFFFVSVMAISHEIAIWVK